MSNTAPARKPVPNRATRRAAPKPPTGTFARLKAEASTSVGSEIEPYVIEDVDPPISITPPVAAEQQMALAELFGADGQFRVADARRILVAVCGDSFDAVWELFRKEDIQVLVALIQDMGRHFEEQGALDDVDEEDVPGGFGASST